jgi:hypothetical protein
MIIWLLWLAAIHSTTIRPIELRLSRPPQPLTRRPQFPLIRVHQRTDPFICHHTSLELAIPPLDHRGGAEARGLEVHVHVLPVAGGRLVDLVVEADVGVFLGGLLEPEPGLAVQRGVGEEEDVVDAAPVADEHEFHAAAFVFAGVGCLAEDYTWRGRGWLVSLMWERVVNAAPTFYGMLGHV